MGKQTNLNLKANRKLKKLFEEKEINYCELDLPHDCTAFMGLTNAHRHKRDWYKDKPEELLWSFNQVAKICLPGHMMIEADSEKTADLFIRLRGEEIIPPE